MLLDDQISPAPYRKGPVIPSERCRKRIELVVIAARELFVRYGYHNVTIPAIVQASGVSTGSIYQYFTCKEHLARYIYQQTLTDFQRQLELRLDGCNSTYQKAKAFAELVFDITESDPLAMEYMFFLRHGEFMQEKIPACSTEPFLWLLQTIATGVEDGELNHGNPFLSASAFSGVLLRAVELRLTGVLQQSLRDVGEEIIANAWAAMAPRC